MGIAHRNKSSVWIHANRARGRFSMVMRFSSGWSTTATATSPCATLRAIHSRTPSVSSRLVEPPPRHPHSIPHRHESVSATPANHPETSPESLASKLPASAGISSTGTGHCVRPPDGLRPVGPPQRSGRGTAENPVGRRRKKPLNLQGSAHPCQWLVPSKMARAGLEPATPAFSVLCSTN